MKYSPHSTCIASDAEFLYETNGIKTIKVVKMYKTVIHFVISTGFNFICAVYVKSC